MDDLIVEYVAGFAFGLFIFQALFMRNMMGGTYGKALRSSFLPEWLSMNMMMAGMAPTMVLLMMGRDMRAMEPSEPTFWFVMSLGVVVGFVVAFPVNVWMVARELKHGLMTVRPERARAEPMTHGAGGAQGARDHGGHPTTPHPSEPPVPVVTRTQLVAMTLVTCLALVATPLWAASKVNLALSADDVGGAVMPPGMVMTRDTPAESMRDMSAVDPELVGYEAPDDAAGAQALDPRLVDGVKEFDLTASVISWPILDGQG